MNILLEIVLPVVSFLAIAVFAGYVIKRLGPFISSASPENVDCVLYVTIGTAGALQSLLSGEGSYNYCNPYVLFWMKVALGAVLGGATAMKAFRSGRKKTP